jgi:hypothetical protein
MNTIDFAKNNFPITSTVLGFLQSSTQLIEKLSAICGDYFILSGCIKNGNSITSGYVVANGEVMPFDGGIIQQYVRIDATEQIITIKDTNYKKTTKKLVFTSTPVLEWSIFKRPEEIYASLVSGKVPVSQLPAPQLQYPGVVRRIYQYSDETNIDFGIDNDNSNNYYYISPSYLKLRKPFRKYTIIDQSANYYSIDSTTDILHINYINDYQRINFPSPTENKNRIIAIYGAHQIDSINAYPTDEWNYSGNRFMFSCWLSTGQLWIPVAIKNVVACPYLYINGQKSCEILRNLFGENNKIEEITDISEYILDGKNRISVKELKDEVSYFDYAYIRINGKKIYDLFAGELKSGESINIIIDVNISDKVEIVAKGYYDLSEKIKKELQFGNTTEK